MFVAVDGELAGLLGVADPIKADDAEAIAASTPRAPHRHADRRQPRDRRGGRAAARHRRGRGGRAARAKAATSIKALQSAGPDRRDGGRRHQRRAGARRGRTSGSRWAPAPTSRSRAPASRSSRATCAASSARGAEPRDDAQHPAEPVPRVRLQRLGVPVAAGVLYPFFGILLSPMLASAAMSSQLGVGHRQRAPPPPRGALTDSFNARSP